MAAVQLAPTGRRNPIAALPDQKNTPKLPQVLTAVGSCICCLAIGGTLGYTSPAVPSMQKDEDTIFLRGLTLEEIAWIGSLSPLGAFIGSVCGGPVVEFLGRRKTLLYVSAPSFLASWLLVGLAKWIYMVYAGRFLAGLMIGLSFLACPVYISETATVGLRGTFGSFPQLILVTGILLVYALGAAFQWRLLALVLGIPVAVIQAVVMYFMPESPTWLVHNGRRNEARKALLWLRGTDYDVDAEMAFIDQSLTRAKPERAASDRRDDLEDPRSSITGKSGSRVNLKDFRHPNVLIPFSIAMMLMLVQQLSGINAVIFYSVSIFDNAGIGASLGSHLSAVVVGVVMTAATAVASVSADRAGRRPLLIASSALMAASMVVLTAYFFLYGRPGQTHGGGVTWIPLVGVAVFLVSFSLGYGPLPWLLSTEMLPPRVKATAASVSFGFNWLLVFVVTRSFPSLSHELGTAGVFCAFTVVCVLGCVATVLFVPETKNKDLAEIQTFFCAKCPCCFGRRGSC